MARAHVLVVDDEPNILSSLQKALSLEGYTVEGTGGVQAAREKLKKKTFDIALVDISLPDGTGLDLLAAGESDTTFLMMSGQATIDLAVRATKLGAAQFFEKPVHTDALLATIDTILRLRHAERIVSEVASAAPKLVGTSAAMSELRDKIARVAKSAAPVLVTGERGTGKELVASALHEGSPRAKGPLEKLNCAALPRELIESELFGHEVGAFTGATKQRRGRFERSHNGTLFLDEVGELPLDAQAKLLRVLQEREFERVGGSEVIRVDVRVIAATNRNLAEMVEERLFRADLLDRLNVLPVHLPPLRARGGDIGLLASAFFEDSKRANARRNLDLTDGAIRRIAKHAFPGNVRELRNLIERLVILVEADKIQEADVENALGPGGGPASTGSYFRPGVPFRDLVESAERDIVRDAIKHFDGQMTQTAKSLDLERSYLYKKVKALGLKTDDDA